MSDETRSEREPHEVSSDGVTRRTLLRLGLLAVSATGGTVAGAPGARSPVAASGCSDS